jgi:HK97 family phage major capsid protein
MRTDIFRERAGQALDRLTAMKNKNVAEGRGPNKEEQQEAQRLLEIVEGIEAGADLAFSQPLIAGRPDPNYSPLSGLAQTAAPGLGALRGPGDRTFRGMFCTEQPQARLSDGGFRNCEEFLEIVASGRHDSRLIRAAMVEREPSSGGFSVPDEFSSRWLDAALPTEIIRPRCTVWPMASKTRRVPAWDDLNQGNGKMFGGFAMEFLAEEGSGTYQSGKLRSLELNAQKAGIFTQVSNELLADGLTFEQQLERALVGSIGYGFDKHCLRGTGAGQPLGILNANSLIVVAKEPGQLATILYENLAAMWSRVYSPCRRNAVWIANDDCIPQLLQCSIQLSGLAGQFYPVMRESDGGYAIFGRPVLFSPIMGSLGELGDILLVDLGQYALGLRKEMGIDRSQHVGFQQDIDSWRILVRFDGQPTWNSAYVPEHGLSQSWAVTLEARG